MLSLPRPHAGQRRVLASPARFRVLACGRRWGKTTLGEHLSVQAALAGRPVGWFGPTYRFLSEPWRTLRQTLAPVARRMSEDERRIDLITGGSISFFSLDDPDAGRGRRLALALVDEAAIVRDLARVWAETIRPTLTDDAGQAAFLSTPRGRGDFFALFSQEGEGWASFHAPSAENPHLPAAEIEAARGDLSERAFRQEYLAEFADEEGAVFGGVREAVDEGRTSDDPPDPTQSYVMGVDLGRHHDWTVATVLDPNGRQVAWRRWRGQTWTVTALRLAELVHAYDAVAHVDSTGLGDPVCELLKEQGARVRPVVFTAESKATMMERLALRFERQGLRLMDVPVQTAELESFAYRTSASGRVVMEGPPHGHDDCVCALALAAQALKRPARVT